MKTAILTIIILLSGLFASAQVDDIKDKAEKNKKDEKKDLTEEVTVFDTPDAACVNACVSVLFDAAFRMAVTGLMNHHQYIMQKIADPMKLSFELIPQTAYGFHLNQELVKTYDYLNLLPQFRARWGVIGADLRYNLLLDFYDYSVDAYRLAEGNIQFNIQPFIEHRFVLGSGIAWEPYTLSIYNEHIAGYHYLDIDMRFKAHFETRIALDYTFPTPIAYSEINMGAGIKVLELPKLFGFANAGFMFQKYFMEHDIWLLYAGFTFNVH